MTANFDPVAISLGSLEIRWYGLMYVIGFLLGWYFGRKRALRYGWAGRDVDDLVTICMLGCILGGRLGYIIFYDLPVYLNDPMEMLRFWDGGMSFHGAAIGLALAFCYFAKTRKCHFIDIADFITPLVPQGLLFGRIGNFINGELWGKTTDLPWGVIFPDAGPLPRHPSQLYESFLEGIGLPAAFHVGDARLYPSAIDGSNVGDYGARVSDAMGADCRLFRGLCIALCLQGLADGHHCAPRAGST